MFRGMPNGISHTLAEDQVRMASISRRGGMVESVACDHTGSSFWFCFGFLSGWLFGFRL